MESSISQNLRNFLGGEFFSGFFGFGLASALGSSILYYHFCLKGAKIVNLEAKKLSFKVLVKLASQLAGHCQVLYFLVTNMNV